MAPEQYAALRVRQTTAIAGLGKVDEIRFGELQRPTRKCCARWCRARRASR
jgi:hypothetical protein